MNSENKDFFDKSNNEKNLLAGATEADGPKAINESFDVENHNIESVLYQFLDKVTPTILTELKLQNMKAKKKNSFQFRANMMQTATNARTEIQIDIEEPDPIIHSEITLNRYDVIDVGITYIPMKLKIILDACIADVENQRERVLQEMIKAGEGDPRMIIAGARRILKCINTRHYIQLSLVTYPIQMNRVESLLNHFWRNRPPIDPSQN